MMQNTSFDQEAAMAAILYVADRVPSLTMHKLAKILYFADRLHLENYGRQIFGDYYIAFNYGPVPGRVYDLVKQADSTRAPEGLFGPVGAEEHLIVTRKNGFQYIAARHEANLDSLSESDTECLDQVIEEWQGADFWTMSDESHDFAWKEGRKRINQRMELDDILETLPNGELVRAHLQEPNP